MYNYSSSKKLFNTDLNEFKDCFTPVKKVFNKGEIIIKSSSENDKIGIIEKGTAYMITINSDAQRRILEYYQSGNMLGKSFIPINDNTVYYIVAKTECTVNFISYKKLLTCCEKSCEKHISIIDSMLMTSTQKAILHIDILGQRTLRGKLLAFFEHLRIQKNSNNFTIPLPLIDLADYLATDRSAMMRELKKLNQEGIIKSDKRKVTLIDNNHPND
ncbi:MAG: Crp/Fnr family transcriptional regulator [Ruminococcus sp.]|nr:Crp/Fnr family transcriptional regulator [Ruminococcus sp.]